MAMMTAKITDSQGNKAEIEVTEFKTLQDAYKVILELQKEIQELKEEVRKLKNGSRNI